MTAYIERLPSYKLTFSAGHLTVEEIEFIRTAMNKLERKSGISKCFQNINVREAGGTFTVNCPEFSVYYATEGLDCLNKFLFKMQLKFANFVIHTTQTLQEFS